MTIAEWIAALGTGGAGIYAASKAVPVIIGALRGRSLPDDDRESPVPQDRAAERGRCVTHAELNAALAAHMATVNARVDSAETDCERRTQEAARHSAEQSRELAAQIRSADGKVERALGLLEGFIDGQAAHSRRGR